MGNQNQKDQTKTSKHDEADKKRGVQRREEKMKPGQAKSGSRK